MEEPYATEVAAGDQKYEILEPDDSGGGYNIL